MKKQSGFTFFELILSLVLTTILTGIVVEMIAGPLRSYLESTKQTVKVDIGEQTVDNVAKELRTALPFTVKIEKTQNGQALVFRKILYKGIIVPHHLSQNSLPILGSLPQELLSLSSLKIYLPLSLENKLLDVQLKQDLHQDVLMTGSHLLDGSHPLPFYIVSPVLRYVWDQNAKTLKRIDQGVHEDVIANQVQDCQFIAIHDNKSQGMLVSLSIGDVNPIKMKQPILYEITL